jgi:diguanylate cyclase (GGDEF)-like protein
VRHTQRLYAATSKLSEPQCHRVQPRAITGGTALDGVAAVRLITRDDTSLTVALIAATIILFRQPLRYGLDIVQVIEGRYQLDLLPALLLLVMVFSFHQYRKWTMARAEARAAEADAAQARHQSLRMQQLMAFSRALSNALDQVALQQVLWQHMPGLASNRGFWVFTRERDRWGLVIQEGIEPLPTAAQLLQFAERAASSSAAVDGDRSSGGASIEDAWFPLVAGSDVVGVMGITGSPALALEQRNLAGAAAAIMAIGVKNMQLFLNTRELSLRDSLTGCFNRGHALDALDAELRRSRRTNAPLSILMFDVDHFKSVNDRFGHLRGDDLLSAIGEQLGRSMRSTDIRCRYGGDEFLIILPETPLLGAHKVADALRQDLASLNVGSGDGNRIAVTVSVGVAAAADGELDAKAFIQRADEALYRAKRAGRNRSCIVGLSASGNSPSRPRAVPNVEVPLGLTARVG